MKKYTSADAFLSDLPLWKAECARLCKVMRSCDVEEVIKWGKPCYTHDNKNIAIIQPMKGFLALMFFKGALLDDPEGLLEEQGPNTRSAKRLCFRSAQEIDQLASSIRDLVASAIRVEARGTPLRKAAELELVEELAQRLAGDLKLKAAFKALTPGRQRAYNIHISQAKQSSTRERRIDNCVPRILSGKGMRD